MQYRNPVPISPRPRLAWCIFVVCCLLVTLPSCGGGSGTKPAAESVASAATITPTAEAIALANDTPISAVATAPTATTAAPLEAVPAVTGEVVRGETGKTIDDMLSGGVQGQPLRGAVLVAVDGQVTLSRGYGLSNDEQGTPNGPDTPFRIGSITKPFTALAVLILHDQGKLDVQAPVCTYIPQCPAAWANVTLHHLLTHTSGIPDLTRTPGFAQFATRPATPMEVMARFSELPLDFAAGDRWQYSNSNYIVLGVVIEQVSQQRYAGFMQDHIFEPLHMANSGYDHNLDIIARGYKPNGAPADFIDMSVPFAAGALYASVADLYAWDRALRMGQLLSPQLQAEMFTAHAPMPEDGPLSYGYGWIIGRDVQGVYSEHVGTINGFSGKIRRYLEQDAVIFVLSNHEGTNPNPIVDRIAAIIFSP